MTTTTILQVKGLGRHKLGQLAARARRRGVTTEEYVKQLVEEDLAVSREARSKTFAELMGPGRAVDENEVDRLVEKAKARHHARTSRKRR